MAGPTSSGAPSVGRVSRLGAIAENVRGGPPGGRITASASTAAHPRCILKPRLPFEKENAIRKHNITLGIFEGKGGFSSDGKYPSFVQEGICAWMLGDKDDPEYKVGQTFQYPDEMGQLCPWLVDSLTGFLRALENGGTLPWRYRGTPYEKEIDPDGVTTEYVRCPDSTACGIVIKITRTALPE